MFICFLKIKNIVYEVVVFVVVKSLLEQKYWLSEVSEGEIWI